MSDPSPRRQSCNVRAAIRGVSLRGPPNVEGLSGGIMILYHATARATDILAGGFRDKVSYELVTRSGRTITLTGVPLIDQPILKAGRDLLVVDLPDAIHISDYEVVEEDSPPGRPREWLVPADLLNQVGRVTLWTDND